MAASSATLKEEGNRLYAQRKFEKAIEVYSRAVENDPTDKTLYGNRSAAHLDHGNADAAAADALEAIRLDPSWARGHQRLAAALLQCGKCAEGAKAAAAGLVIDPKNADLKKLRELCTTAAAAAGDRFSEPVAVGDLLRLAQTMIDTEAVMSAPGVISIEEMSHSHPKIAMSASDKRGRILTAVAPIGEGQEILSEIPCAWYCSFGDTNGAAIPGLLEISPAFEATGLDLYSLMLQLEPFALTPGRISTAGGGAVSPRVQRAEVCIRAASRNFIGTSWNNAVNSEETTLCLMAPVCAMMNHDCNPNARYVAAWDADARAPRVRVSSLRDIAAGEEITISYIGTSQAKRVRQTLLLRRYGFLCRCSRCAPPQDDTVVFACPECAAGRVFGGASACADCGACVLHADPPLAALPSPSAPAHPLGGAWAAQRAAYLEAATPGHPRAPSIFALALDGEGSAAGGVGASRRKKKGGAPLAAAGGGAGAPGGEGFGDPARSAGDARKGAAAAGATETGDVDPPSTVAASPMRLHLQDAGRMQAIAARLGEAWPSSSGGVAAAARSAAVFAAVLPAMAAAAGHMWDSVLPQSALLAGHVHTAAGDAAAAAACYRDSAARYASAFGPRHAYTSLAASLVSQPPADRAAVERFEGRRLAQGSWEAQGLPPARAAKWFRPLKLLPPSRSGGASGGAAEEALLRLEERRVLDALKELAARFVGALPAAARKGAAGAPLGSVAAE